MELNDQDRVPIPGLPGHLPPGEELLWQGKPDWRRLAIEAFALKWIALWVLLFFLGRSIALTASESWPAALISSSPILILGVLGIGLFLLIGYFQAKTTIYTITSRRVVMKIGAALSITINVPFQKVAGANLSENRDGSGNIAIELMPESLHLSYFVLWPHARPWHMRLAQPCLRAVPDAAKVAHILAEAAETELARPQISGPIPTQPVAAE